MLPAWSGWQLWLKAEMLMKYLLPQSCVCTAGEGMGSLWALCFGSQQALSFLHQPMRVILASMDPKFHVCKME